MTNIDYSLLKGKFITFDGIEGTGKGTQIKLLHPYLLSKGLDVLLTREPGGTHIGSKLRRILVEPETTEEKLLPLTELFTYAADRAQHIDYRVRPAIEAGKLVLCDRFADASFAYQGYGRGINIELIKRITGIAVAGLDGKSKVWPDLTFLIDLAPEIGVGRAKRREIERTDGNAETRFEDEEYAFHERVREGYLALARKEPNRYRIFNGDQAPEKIHAQIVETLEDYIISISK